MERIEIFVGYDPREAVAYSVFCHSVLSRTKAQVSFTPICGSLEPGASNTFSRARFEIAFRLGYKGWGLWAESDMLCRADIAELWSLREPQYDVMCVQHSYSTKWPLKYLGQANEDYPRKQWSSLFLVNAGNYPWRKLTPEYVAKAKPSHLHRFEFLKDERIGDLPAEWNHIVGENEPREDVKIAHFSIGTPCWKQYQSWPYAQEWLKEREAMNHYQPWTDETPQHSER